MKAVNKIILSIFLIPFLFVMGVVASTAQTMGTLPAAGYETGIDMVTGAGENLMGITGSPTLNDMELLLDMTDKIVYKEDLNIKEDLHRIRNLTARNA
ncbi:MAG: hypothetical protein ABH843_01800 [Candidatus Omnitrophota bacterium]